MLLFLHWVVTCLAIIAGATSLLFTKKHQKNIDRTLTWTCVCLLALSICIGTFGLFAQWKAYDLHWTNILLLIAAVPFSCAVAYEPLSKERLHKLGLIILSGFLSLTPLLLPVSKADLINISTPGWGFVVASLILLLFSLIPLCIPILFPKKQLRNIRSIFRVSAWLFVASGMSIFIAAYLKVSAYAAKPSNVTLLMMLLAMLMLFFYSLGFYTIKSSAKYLDSLPGFAFMLVGIAGMFLMMYFGMCSSKEECLKAKEHSKGLVLPPMRF